MNFSIEKNEILHDQNNRFIYKYSANLRTDTMYYLIMRQF